MLRGVRKVAVVVALGAALCARAEEPLAFGPGEQIRYQVSYLGVVAGEAQVTVGWRMQQFGREVWPLVCAGRTTALTDVVRVRDRFVSYWDPTLGQSVGADYFADENHKKRRERFEYDLSGGKIRVTRQKPGQPPSERIFDSPTAPFDLAAAGFSLRTKPLEVGAVYDMPIFTGVKLFTMHAKVEAKEKLQTQLGELEVYRVSFNGEFEGKLKTKSDMTIYFTADERRVPVRGKADLLLGSLMIDAVAWEPGHTPGK